MKAASGTLLTVSAVLLGSLYATSGAESGQVHSPLERLKGTWRVECTVSTVTVSGGVYSGTEENCQQKDYPVQISEDSTGMLSFKLQAFSRWPDGRPAELISEFRFSIRKGSAPNTYLLSVDTYKKLLDALPLSYSDQNGFSSQLPQDSETSGTIKFNESGEHTWDIKTQGPRFKIRFLTDKKGS